MWLEKEHPGPWTALERGQQLLDSSLGLNRRSLWSRATDVALEHQPLQLRSAGKARAVCGGALRE